MGLHTHHAVLVPVSFQCLSESRSLLHPERLLHMQVAKKLKQMGWLPDLVGLSAPDVSAGLMT